MAFCNQCGVPIADGATICAACAARTQAPPPYQGVPAQGATQVSTQGMSDNVAGMIAYITIIPAIIFLIVDPYSRNRFIRFHAWQCIFFNLAWWALWFVLRVIVHVPFFGWLTLLIWPLVGLGGFIAWLILVLKAYQGQMFKLPVIGDMAEKQASAM